MVPFFLIFAAISSPHFERIVFETVVQPEVEKNVGCKS